METRKLVAGLVTVFVLGVLVLTVVCTILPDHATPMATLEVEIAKAALSGCIVAVIGVAIAALVKSREQSSQESKLRASILAQFLDDVGDLYRSVKAARRQLRAIGLTTNFGAVPDTVSDEQLRVYQEQLSIIDKAQLTLESWKLRVGKLPLFRDVSDVASRLRDMEDYLRVLLSERERVTPKIISKESVPFRTLVRLQEFTGSTSAPSPVSSDQDNRDYRFETHFATPYDQLLDSIAQYLDTPSFH